jgi:Lon-like protease
MSQGPPADAPEPDLPERDVPQPEPTEPEPPEHEAQRPRPRHRIIRWWRGSAGVRTPRERARRRALRRGGLGAAALLVAGSWVQLPLLVTSPGPTFNTLGDVDGTAMITITGTTTYPTEGALDMTTVSERGGSSGGVYLGEAVVAWFAPKASLIPREVYYDPRQSGEEVAQRNDQLFATSQSDAIAASMRELGIATEESVVVTMVGGGTPADGIVRAGDVIQAVDGVPMNRPADVGLQVLASAVGRTVVLDVLRTQPDGTRAEQRLEVVAGANPSTDPRFAGTPWLGIAVGPLYEAPFDIDFADSNVGGPSAGLMFSMAIVDKLTPGPLTGGGHVAGTGTIDPAGQVGPIGGIDKKLLGARSSGATLFLAPPRNCGEVVGRVPDGLTVVPVATLDRAVHVVESWADDPTASFPTCQEVLDGQDSTRESEGPSPSASR